MKKQSHEGLGHLHDGGIGSRKGGVFAFNGHVIVGTFLENRFEKWKFPPINKVLHNMFIKLFSMTPKLKMF